MQEAMYELRHDETEQAEVLAEWAKKKMGLSACLCDCMTGEKKQNPVAAYASNVEDRKRDIQLLKEAAAMHDCSGYCMRESNKGDKEAYCKLHDLDT